MKNFKNLLSFFLILSILSISFGILSVSATTLKKEGFNFDKDETSRLFLQAREEINPTTEELPAKESLGQELKTKEGKDEARSLENLKLAEREEKNYVEGEILIKYKKNKINLETSSGRAAAENFSRAKSMERKEDLREINISVLKIKDDKTVEEKIAELKNDPNVEFVEPNYKRYPTVISSNDYYKDLLWGLDNTGQEVGGVTGTDDADIDAPEAWTISEGSSD